MSCTRIAAILLKLFVAPLLLVETLLLVGSSNAAASVAAGFYPNVPLINQDGHGDYQPQ